jgi:hypothetical protein
MRVTPLDDWKDIDPAIAKDIKIRCGKSKMLLLQRKNKGIILSL